MRQAYSINRRAISICEVKETVVVTEAISQNGVHSFCLFLQYPTEVVEKGLQPWRDYCLAIELVDAAGPGVCLVTKVEN